MRQIPTAVTDRLSTAARRLRAARRSALDRVAVEETEWEYAGRTWSWPAGEARTYFHELAPGEREVLDDLTADLADLAGTDERVETGTDAGPTAAVVGIGTGRVAVAVPGAVGGGSAVTADGDPLVAKLARYGPSAEMGDGRPQNRRERRVWSAVESHPFLPVLDADGDGDWIVMPRAQVPPDEDVRGAALDGVRTALGPHRDRFHFDELKPANVGAYRGRYWVVDYGRPAGEPLFVYPPTGSERGASGTGEPSDADAGENRQDRSNKN
jgi:hypothetical protein